MTTATIHEGYAQLLALPQWVNADAAKCPYTPSVRGPRVRAKAGDPATFGDAPTALAAQAAGRFPHVGFQFTAADPFFLVDLDDCRDPATGALTPRARAIVALLDSLAEPSVSGTGLHIVATGTPPRDLLGPDRLGRKCGDCELYFANHYGIATFRPLPGYQAIRDVDEATMRLLWALLFPADAAPHPQRPAPPPPREPVTDDDAALLARAFAARGGDDFRRRHHGDCLLGDPSRDDCAYLGVLYFWTQADPARMRRIALSSARAREKWHSRRGATDWLDYSIARVCRAGGAVYDPGRAHCPPPAAAGTPGGDAARIATLETDVRRLGDEVRRLQRENADLRATVDAWEAAARHPDQTIGGSAFDLAEAVEAAYRRGDVLTRDGQDYARVVIKQAKNRRSATTIGHALKRIKQSGEVAVIAREEAIETASYKGKVEINYIAVPAEARRRTADIVRSLLPTPTEKKHGGKRPRIAVPRSQEYPAAPVRRVTETWQKFFCAVDQQLLDSSRLRAHTDYFTCEGEAISFEEASRIQVELGYAPPAAPSYRPQASQTRIQLEDIDPIETPLQVEFGPPDDELPADGCRACGRPRVHGTLFCARHRPGGDAWQAAASERGYRGAGDYAAGGG